MSNALGQGEKARRALAATREEARRAGLVVLQLEADLALGKLEFEQGAVVSARARLKSVEESARARGLGLLARQAAEASRI